MKPNDKLVVTVFLDRPFGQGKGEYERMVFSVGNPSCQVYFEKDSMLTWAMHFSSEFIQRVGTERVSMVQSEGYTSEVEMQSAIKRLLNRGCSIAFVLGDEHGRPLV